MRYTGVAPKRRRSRRALGMALAGFVLSWLVPATAVACTVCMGGQEEASRKAFVGTTAFLTFFPLLMLGIGVGWFVRRTLAQEREDEADAARERIEALAPPR
jgi:hypothetical protein